MSTSHAPCLPSDGFSQWNSRVWRLAGPIILANISTPLLGAVDTAVMGHLPEAAYIGGVAIGAVIFDFLFWGFGFLQMSTSGFTSQAHGAGDQVEVRATLIRAMALAVALGLLLILLQRPIVTLAFAVLDTSPQVEGLARSYYAIRIWSAPLALANYVVLGWL
ncbi:MAG: MATE family efflux transporter, partial [Alphaproteobacteria bacterium]